MATVTESSEDEKPNVAAASDTVFKSQSLQDGNPWIDNAVREVMIYRKIVEESIDSAIEASRSRLSQTRLTASVHFQQTLVSFYNIHYFWYFRISFPANSIYCSMGQNETLDDRTIIILDFIFECRTICKMLNPSMPRMRTQRSER